MLKRKNIPGALFCLANSQPSNRAEIEMKISTPFCHAVSPFITCFRFLHSVRRTRWHKLASPCGKKAVISSNGLASLSVLSHCLILELLYFQFPSHPYFFCNILLMFLGHESHLLDLQLNSYHCQLLESQSCSQAEIWKLNLNISRVHPSCFIKMIEELHH